MGCALYRERQSHGGRTGSMEPQQVFAQGFAASGALIVAIGAQNAFVLRQGLKREHVLAVVSVCALSDVLLIGLGVGGVGLAVQQDPGLLLLARVAGAAFLAAYGFWAARRALRGASMHVAANGPMSLRAALAACLAFTYLNPHCWLDTVVLLGAIAGQYEPAQRGWFGAGACTASVLWFALLGYGARRLSRWFAQPAAWRVLDAAVALVMWGLALSLWV
jgi:L-lysine exporter family protein LysE/ArgO